MSHWDHKQGVVVRWKPHPVEGYDGWWATDCGCSGGIQWGGDSPRECRSCMGGGVRFIHLATRTVAAWPGGPLLGAKASDYFARVIRRFVVGLGKRKVLMYLWIFLETKPPDALVGLTGLGYSRSWAMSDWLLWAEQPCKHGKMGRHCNDWRHHPECIDCPGGRRVRIDLDYEALAEFIYDNFIAWLPDDNRWKHSTNEAAKDRARKAARSAADALGLREDT